jgi:hypothetical protein
MTNDEKPARRSAFGFRVSVFLRASSSVLRIFPLPLIAVLAGTAFSSGQTASGPSPLTPRPSPPDTPSPRIELGAPVFEFGQAEAGDVVKHDFMFTNTGNALLEIRDVRPGCGCTTASNYDKRVEAGKIGVIPVQFNSAGYSGPVGKEVYVSCNDPVRSNLVLRLKGTVRQPIEVDPLFARFSLPVETPTNQTRAVKIINHLDEPLTLSSPVCSNRLFQAEVITVKPGKEFELRVTVLPPLGAGSVAAPITLKTSSAKVPLITVTAYASLQPLILATPSQVYLAQAPLADAWPLTVTIQNNSTNSLVLTEPSINAPGVDVQLQEVQPGRLFKLAASFPAGFQRPANTNLELRVKSNFPQLPIVKVSLFQQLKPQATPPSSAAK